MRRPGAEWKAEKLPLPFNLDWIQRGSSYIAHAQTLWRAKVTLSEVHASV